MLRLCPLHRFPTYQDDVLQLLNEQWPQSRTIRLRRLERSSDDFPISFILLNDEEKLIGYCYVDRLFNDEHSVIVESICIQRTLRRQGHGKQLLKLLEDELRQHPMKIERIFLTTTDQREFYDNCGYEETSPRVRLNVSSQLFHGNEQLLKNFLSQQTSPINDSHVILQKGSKIERIPTIWMKKELWAF